MAKYRKRPVVIDAIEVTNANLTELETAFAHDDRVVLVVTNELGLLLHVEIETLEGTMRANIGDYIIRGVKGELYPCKPDVFAATYDRFDPADPRQLTSADAFWRGIEAGIRSGLTATYIPVEASSGTDIVRRALEAFERST